MDDLWTYDTPVMAELNLRRYDLASLKIVLRSIVVSSPTQVTLRSLLQDYQTLMRKPMPIYRFGYSDPLRFIQDKCSDCFRLQGGTSNPLVSVIVSNSLPYIDVRGENQRNSNANTAKGKGSSIPDTSVGPATLGQPRQYGYVSGRSSSSSGSIICTCTEQQRMHASQEPCEANHSSQENYSSTRTSSSQRSSKRAQGEDPKDEIHAVTKDSKDGVSCKMDPAMHYQERFTPISCVAQTLGDRLHITGNAADDDDDDSDMLLQDVAAALPYPVRNEPATCSGGDGDGDAGGSPAPSMDHGSSATYNEDALPYEEEVFPIDCLQYGESVPYIDISTLKPGDNIEVIVGEVYSPSHFWVIRTGPDYEIAMEELVHEMTEYFEIGEGRKRYLAKYALRLGQYCAAFYNCHWHRAIIVEVIRGGELIKVRHFDYGTMAIVPPELLRPFLRCWARLPRQALRARLAGVRPAWGGQSWSHAASEYFLRQVDERTLMAKIVAINNAEAILEMFLVDTTQREDFEIARDLVQAGFADVRRNSAVRITQPDDRYLHPDFSSIEKAATPLFHKIQQYVYNNICLGYTSYSVVSEKRHHVAPNSQDAVVMALINTLGSPPHSPTATPAPRPTTTPAARPTATSAARPTATSAARPTATPAARPTATPAARPTATPAARPTATPAARPTTIPAPRPTTQPRPTATTGPRPTTRPPFWQTATPAPRPTATIAPRTTALPGRRPTTRPMPRQTATPAPPRTITQVIHVPYPPTPYNITTRPPTPSAIPASPRLSPSPGLPNPAAMDPMPPYHMPQFGMVPPQPTIQHIFPGNSFDPQLLPHPSMYHLLPTTPPPIGYSSRLRYLFENNNN